MKLSILIPSKRPKELANFIESLKNTAHDFSKVELVVLKDVDKGHLMWRDENITYVSNPPSPFISEIMYECYSHATGDWILFGNDDLIMETPNWDLIFEEVVKTVPDQIAMFYPNDTIFGPLFPCFPLVSRKFLEVSKFFPLPPYRRHKVDDVILHILPPNRIFYLQNVVLRHLNKVEGDNVGINKFGYKFLMDSTEEDQKTWDNTAELRKEMKERLSQCLTM